MLVFRNEMTILEFKMLYNFQGFTTSSDVVRVHGYGDIGTLSLGTLLEQLLIKSGIILWILRANTECTVEPLHHGALSC